MAQLLVRKIENAVIRQLRRKAAADGTSLEEAHRQVLRQALLGAPAPAGNFLEFLQTMPAGLPLPPRAQDQRPPLEF